MENHCNAAVTVRIARDIVIKKICNICHSESGSSVQGLLFFLWDRSARRARATAWAVPFLWIGNFKF